MPFDPNTGVFTRVANSFSNPIPGTIIDPNDADALFDDYDAALTNINQSVNAISVKEFGAVGDGVADDTQALRDAAAAGLASNSCIVVPPGTYKITGSITQHNPTVDQPWPGPCWEGVPGKSIIKPEGFAGPAFHFRGVPPAGSPVATTYFIGGGISGMDIDGANLVGQPGFDFIDMTGWRRGTFTDCTWKNGPRHCIVSRFDPAYHPVPDFSASQTCTFRGCWADTFGGKFFFDTAEGCSAGFVFNNCQTFFTWEEAFLLQSTFMQVGPGTGIAYAGVRRDLSVNPGIYGVIVGQSSSSTIQGVEIFNCEFQSCSGGDIWLVAVLHCFINNNRHNWDIDVGPPLPTESFIKFDTGGIKSIIGVYGTGNKFRLGGTGSLTGLLLNNAGTVQSVHLDGISLQDSGLGTFTMVNAAWTAGDINLTSDFFIEQDLPVPQVIVPGLYLGESGGEFPVLPVASPDDQRVSPGNFAVGASVTNLPGDVDPVSIMGSGPGQVVLTKTPYQVALRRHAGQLGTYGRCFVDPVNGLDANPGTEAQPFQTLAHACKVSTIPIVIPIPSGPFMPFDLSSATDAGAAVLKIISAERGPITIANSGPTFPLLPNQVFTNTVGNPLVWETSLAAMDPSDVVENIVDNASFDQFGMPIAFGIYTSIAALQAAGSGIRGFFFDVATQILYVNYFGLDANVQKFRFKAYYGDASAGGSRIGVLGNSKLLLLGPIDLDGTELAGQNIGALQPSIYVQGDLDGGHLRCMFSPTNGISLVGGAFYGSGYRVHAPRGDCHNYNVGSEGSPAGAIEHDVIATNAGSPTAYNVSGALPQGANGSSGHAGTNVLRAGGKYIESWGANIGDSNPAAGINSSWCIGVITQNSLAGFGIQSIGNLGGSRTMWLDTCRTSNEATCALATGVGGNLKHYNCVFNTDGEGTISAAAGGVLTPYTPLAP